MAPHLDPSTNLTPQTQGGGWPAKLLQIRPFSDDLVSAVRGFNSRLAAGGQSARFPESPTPNWIPRQPGSVVWQEYFLAVQDGEVRGAYVLKPQPFFLNGQVLTIADYRLPISEGTVNPRYGMMGMILLKDALARQPLLFGLGMGGLELQLPKLLKTMKWSLASCPFWLKVLRPGNFFREIRHLRRRPGVALLLDAAAISGIGWITTRVLQSIRARSPRDAAVASEVVGEFGPWADQIWAHIGNGYALVAVRDAEVLNTLYPPTNERFLRMRVHCNGETVGWAVMMNTQMQEDKYFGNMRLGSIVDCLAVPGHEFHVVAQATAHLARCGVDLVVTNQLHRSWCSAFAWGGYLRGPSNFVFAASPKLTERLSPFEINVQRVHMTRGDGDGPENL